MRRPTIQDVARFAGVGTTTVSRVLNDHASASPRARERVLSAVQALAYVPNPAALRFRTGQTHAVSVLLPLLSTEFYNRLFGSVQEVLGSADLDMALFPVLEGIVLKRYRDPYALLYHADGMLIVSLEPDRLYEGERSPFAKPVVLLDAHHPKYHSVFFDNLAAGRVAAEHALASGLPVMLVDVEDVPGAFASQAHRERKEGIMQALERQGISLAASIKTPFSTEGGRQAATRLLEAGFLEEGFVISTTDDVAVGVAKHLADRGRTLGADVKVLGFDDGSLARDAGLTTVHQPIEAMGRAAATVLLSALAGELSVIEQRRFAPRLVVRGSA